MDIHSFLMVSFVGYEENEVLVNLAQDVSKWKVHFVFPTIAYTFQSILFKLEKFLFQNF